MAKSTSKHHSSSYFCFPLLPKQTNTLSKSVTKHENNRLNRIEQSRMDLIVAFCNFDQIFSLFKNLIILNYNVFIIAKTQFQNVDIRLT